MRFSIPAFLPEGFLLFAVVFGPLAFGAVEPWSKLILEIDFFLLLAACLLSGKWGLDQAVHKTILPAVIVLLLIGLCQVLNPRSPLAPAPLLPSTVSPIATRQTLVLWASYAALIWSAPQVFRDRDAQRRFAWTLFAVGTFIAVEGIIQLGQGNTAYYGLRPVRQGLPFGPYVNRDHAGSFLVMSAFTGLGLFLSRWLSLKRRESLGAKSDLAATQAMMLFLLGVVLCGVLFSKSRGAFNSFFLSGWFVAMLATGFLTRGSWRWSARAVVGLLVPMYFVFLVMNPIYIGDVLKVPDLSTAIRLSMYRSSLKVILDLPIWGAGLGTVQALFPTYKELFIARIVDHVHSDWLEIGLQTGLAGWLALGSGLAGFLAMIQRAWRNDPSHARRCMAAGALAAVIAFLLHEAVDFSFQIPANAAIFLILLCYLGALSAPGADSSKQHLEGG